MIRCFPRSVPKPAEITPEWTQDTPEPSPSWTFLKHLSEEGPRRHLSWLLSVWRSSSTLICQCRVSVIRVMVVLGAWKETDWTPLSFVRMFHLSSNDKIKENLHKGLNSWDSPPGFGFRTGETSRIKAPLLYSDVFTLSKAEPRCLISASFIYDLIPSDP